MKDKLNHGTSEHEGKAWGHGKYANMPQEVKMSEYPKMPHKELGGIDDTESRLEGDAKHLFNNSTLDNAVVGSAALSNAT